MSRRLAALFALCAAIWIVTLGFRGLFNPDEGRYAEISREILASGDWVIPHLNGLVYIEKPPLQYWATAVSEAVFGQNAWAARLYLGLCALATIYVIWAMLRREWGAAAATRGALMLGSSLWFLVLGHQLTLDMSLTLFMTVTFAGFCNAQRSERWRGWMLLSWAGIAAAFMTKGLIAGVLPLFTLIAYSLLQRDLAPWRRLLLVRGAALFAVLCLPWLILIQHRLPSFFQFFFVREHFQRFLTKIENRYQPWWYFIPILLAGILPWLLPALRALWRDWRGGVARPEFDVRRFAWLWCVVIFVFFSASDSKLSTYILPMFPVLALLMATAPLPRLNADLRTTALGMVVLGVLLLAGAALLPRILALPFVYDPRGGPYFANIRPALALMGLCSAAGGIAARRLPADDLRPTLAIALGGFATWTAALWAAAVVAPLYSGAGLVAQLPEALRRDVPVYSVRTYDQSLTFYLRHPVMLVEVRGELDFGLSLEPNKSIATLAAFAPVWRDSAQALAVVEQKTYQQMQAEGFPMVMRATSPKVYIVSRR
ncbi:MAG TPA: phospholipid carrier-dependent glycosyltransferase [Steroidobacteraceae bacterium]|nr:phospholipid carrier-dependent glycosyltransferase [Steroidobacteraceae bacterium]